MGGGLTMRGAWWRAAAWVCALVACAVASTAARAQEIDAAAKNEVLHALTEHLARQAYVGGVDFRRWPEYLEASRDAIDRAPNATAFAIQVGRALGRFGISHVALIPPEAASTMRRTIRIGIGAEVRPAQGGLRVLGLSPESAAGERGLQPGDVITHVDGERATTPEALEGDSGSVAVLRVRKLSGETREIRVERVLTERRQPAEYRELSERTALIRIPTFNQGYDPFEIEELVARAFWKPGLVIDLRGNGGGKVSNLLHLMSLLAPEGEAFGTPVTNELAARFVEATGGDPSDARAVAAWSTDHLRVPPNESAPYPGRLGVLIDGGSASASEVTSAALRDLRGAVLVGRTSAGALLVSRYLPLPHGFVVQVPVSDYITRGGERPEGVGVKPDIEVERPARGEDAAAAAVMRALEGV
ncbi:MAG: S41 family peptidase [Planctomycetota bacterium]|nr:S41 family peptidase [Planctomycetota bacterium]